MENFSVLIAHYNNFEYFKDCYNSLLDQTFKDFEVVIVDDFSTDDSFEKVRKLTENDPRFRLYQNDHNRGVGYTKKRCVALAEGKICGFVDPDDALEKDAIEVSLRNHDESNVAAYSSFFLCNDQLQPQKRFPHSRAVKNGHKKFFNIFLEANHFFTFKKDAYLKTEGINETLTSAVDQDLYLKLYEVGTFKYINKPLYLYRLHDNGVSQDTSKKIKLNGNWHQVIIDTAKRRKISKLYGDDIGTITDLPNFLKVKQNNIVSKILRKFS